MRSLDTNFADAIARATVRPIWLASIAWESETVRFWSGVGNLVWNSNTYVGGGELISIERITETSDLRAEGYRLALSGIPSDIAASALDDARQGGAVSVYLGFIDETGALAGTPALAFAGLMDVPTVSDDGATSTIGITVESHLIALGQARLKRYTDAEQQAEYSGDEGLEYASDTAAGPVYWGGREAGIGGGGGRGGYQEPTTSPDAYPRVP